MKMKKKRSVNLLGTGAVLYNGSVDDWANEKLPDGYYPSGTTIICTDGYVQAIYDAASSSWSYPTTLGSYFL